MFSVTSLPALLMVLNLGGAPDGEESRGSATHTLPQPKEVTEVGFARVSINREVRFITSDSEAARTIRVLQAAGPEGIKGRLPRQLDARRYYKAWVLCNPVCSRD